MDKGKWKIKIKTRKVVNLSSKEGDTIQSLK